MSNQHHQPPNRIREWRGKRRITLAELARRVGTSAQQMGRLEVGSRRLTQGWMVKLAAALEIRAADLFPLQDGAVLPEPRATPVAPTSVHDLPVFGSERAGAGGLVLTMPPVEHVPRPTPLLGVAQGFGFRVIDNAMDPAYRPGDLVFARPGLEPLPGHDVVLLSAPGDSGDIAAILARFVMMEGETLLLRQFASNDAWQEPRSRWARVAVVVGCFRRL